MKKSRIPYIVERMAPVTYTPDPAYLAGIKAVVDHITFAGNYAVLDTHNFGSIGGKTLSFPADVVLYWQALAPAFADNPLVVFDCMNEWHNQPNYLVNTFLQVCIDGVRSADATSQYIFVEGNNFTAAESWVESGNTVLFNLTDPSKKD
jgi:endoglucanase